MTDNVVSLSAWLTMYCDGFSVVGHRGSENNEFETILIQIKDTCDFLELSGRFNVIEDSNGVLKDALQIHELTGFKLIKEGEDD